MGRVAGGVGLIMSYVDPQWSLRRERIVQRLRSHSVIISQCAHENRIYNLLVRASL